MLDVAASSPKNHYWGELAISLDDFCEGVCENDEYLRNFSDCGLIRAAEYGNFKAVQNICKDKSIARHNYEHAARVAGIYRNYEIREWMEKNNPHA